MFAEIFVLVCLFIGVYKYILNGRHTLFDTHVCKYAHTQTTGGGMSTRKPYLS